MPADVSHDQMMVRVSALTPARVRPLEQIAHGLAPEQRAPAAALMLVPVVQHVAALAERRQVGVLVVSRVVVAVGCCPKRSPILRACETAPGPRQHFCTCP